MTDSRRVLRHLHDQPTMEPCPACDGIAAAGDTCSVCLGVGRVTIAEGDRWRVSKGLRRRYRDLPSPKQPPRKP
jgi:hypothetical protein